MREHILEDRNNRSDWVRIGIFRLFKCKMYSKKSSAPATFNSFSYDIIWQISLLLRFIGEIKRTVSVDCYMKPR